MQTEFDFTLPMGYVDQQGNVHKSGTMRLATAMDEIEPLRDPRVRANEAYLTIILFSRVITQLGTLSQSQITPQVIENLFAPDLAFLQTFYRQIHEQGRSIITVTCQSCKAQTEVDLADLGEVS
jgi:hypothetical protein